MKQFFLSIILSVISVSTLLAQFSAGGGIGNNPYTESTSSNLQNIFLFNSLSGAYLTFTSGKTVAFYKYTSSEGDKTLVPASDIEVNGSVYTIKNIEDSRGYIAEESEGGGVKYTAVWVIDYSKYRLKINSITVDRENQEQCSKIQLIIDKTEIPLTYKSTGGSPYTITRHYTLKYHTLEWNDDNKEFTTVEKTIDTSASRDNDITYFNQPLTNTRFTLTGDQFETHFGTPQSYTSEEYEAIAPTVQLTYEILSDTSSIDGNGEYSAPLEVRFYAHANEPAASFYEWLIFKGDDFANWVARFTNETDITYTFNEAGKYTVQLNVSDASGTCTVTETEEFNISESMLDIPNFFTPNGSPGYNDIFKVKHKSLVKFRATIFNRWGNKLYEWTNPDEGWDGKYKGKYVNPGVYFYVIEATGSEGKKYKKGGDINIVNGNNNEPGSTQP